ncbi:MAG: hypothetical protein LH628_12695 [Microcoleus sp. CAN_BIN18]|nr:hypothetical protein [Microcoleus sp. CAN_BIN18]
MNFSDSTRQFKRKSRATGDRTGSHHRQIPNRPPASHPASAARKTGISG